MLSHDTYDRLPRIDRPTLILTGDDDRIPDSRLELIEGTGHLFFVERPDETVRLLEEFLALPGEG